jgi:hypothetical protein
MPQEILIILGGSSFVLGLTVGVIFATWWAAAVTQRKCQRAAREAWKQARRITHYNGEVKL